MSDTETDYFEITGGEAKKILTEWFAACRKVSQARSVFLKKWKAKTYYGNDRHHGIYAMKFDKEPNQALWRRDPKNGYNWVPRKTTPKGKKLAVEMYSFAEPLFEEVVTKLIGYGDVLIGWRRHYPGLEHIGKIPVISIAALPKDGGDSVRRNIEVKLLDGVKKLKASEYWRRKEREKPAKAKKSA